MRACLVCVTHYSLEYIGDLPYPEIEEILDAYAVMKGGKSAKRRHSRPAPFAGDPELPPQFQQAVDRDKKRDKSGNRVHVTTLPLTLQQRIKELRDKAKRP